LAIEALARGEGCQSGPPVGVDACEGRDGRGLQTRTLTMTNEDENAGYEPIHTASPTDHVLNELQLYGWRRYQPTFPK